MEQSLSDLLGIDQKIDLENLINLPDWIDNRLYRCRISYSYEIEKIEFFEYNFRHPIYIELVENTNVVYPYKFEDRQRFQAVLSQNPQADEVFITHDGYLTDATFANIAFFDGKYWVTPDTPLLKGTKRQYLLDKKLLKEAPVKIEDLQYFKQLSLINAMRDLNIVYRFTFHHNHLIINGDH